MSKQPIFSAAFAFCLTISQITPLSAAPHTSDKDTPAAAQASGSALPLNHPAGLVYDSAGNLYVANSAGNQVLIYGPNLVQRTRLTITAGLNNPTRLAFDSLGDLYVVNTAGGSITVYDSHLKQVVSKTISAVDVPLGVAVDAYGDVFVAENSQNNIKFFNIDAELVNTLTKDNSGRRFRAPGALAIVGQNLYVGTGPTRGENDVTSYNVGEFLVSNPKEITTYTDPVNTGPTGIAVDSTGNVYISDFYSGTATKYSPAGELLLVINDQTMGCSGIALDPQGDIAVSNSNNTITIYSPDGTLLHTLR